MEVMSGYKLVPIEPTRDMERAAESYWNGRRFKGLSDDPRTWAGVYQAMLAAAHQPTGREMNRCKFCSKEIAGPD